MALMDAFAVTIEARGGSPVPFAPNLAGYGHYQRLAANLFYCPFTDNPGGIIVFQVYFSMFMLNWLKSVSYETKSNPCKSLLQQAQSINGVDCGLLYCLLYCEIYSWIVNFDYSSQEEKYYAR